MLEKGGAAQPGTAPSEEYEDVPGLPIPVHIEESIDMAAANIAQPAPTTDHLRPYQREAVNATRRYLLDRKGRAPVLSLPTGSGKAHLAADFAMTATAKGSRTLVLTHRRELLQQNREKLVRAQPALAVHSCYFSAGLAEKRLDKPIVFAGVQSLCRRHTVPAFDLVIIDEAHRTPPLSAGGQYFDCIWAIRTAAQRAGKPDPVWIGLTATPYRTQEGWLWDGEDSIWSGLAYEADMLSLVEQGYLAPLATVRPSAQIDVSKLVKSRGEFTSTSLQEATAPLVDEMMRGAVAQADAEGRKGCMVFTANLALVGQVVAALHRLGVPQGDVVAITGDDATKARDAALGAYKRREARWVVSCGVLTEGFDAPHTDLIVVARAMASPGLWVQIAGRGMRLSPETGKRECVVRDHGSNVERLGPVNAVVPTQGRRGGGGRKQDGEGGGEGGGEPRPVKLSMDPSGSRMMVAPGKDAPEAGSEHWQRVTGREAELRKSSKGNLMVMLTLQLEGKPGRAWEHFVVERGVRSHAGKRYSRLFGTPLPGDPAQALAIAQDRMGSIRRVACRMENGFPHVEHVERSAWSSEERRAAEGVVG